MTLYLNYDTLKTFETDPEFKKMLGDITLDGLVATESIAKSLFHSSDVGVLFERTASVPKGKYSLAEFVKYFSTKGDYVDFIYNIRGNGIFFVVSPSLPIHSYSFTRDMPLWYLLAIYGRNDKSLIGVAEDTTITISLGTLSSQVRQKMCKDPKTCHHADFQIEYKEGDIYINEFVKGIRRDIVRKCHT